MKKIVIIFLTVLIAINLSAQKKELSEAKSYLKTGKNLVKAETLMRSVIAMPGQEKKLDNYILLADIVRKQYESSNEQLYLKQLKDTSSIFTTLCKMFQTYEILDSVEAQPDAKGNVKLRLRKRNAEYLDQFRPNLFNGGIYYSRSHKFKEAYDCLDIYLECIHNPLFESLDYINKDTLQYEAAYWALISARNNKDYSGVAKYEKTSQLYKPKAQVVLATLYENYLERGDTAKAVNYLRQGFREHAEFPFFFPRLVDYYSSRNQLDTVRNIVNTAIDHEPGNMFYRLAKNTIQLSAGNYDDCITLGDSLIHNNDKLAEAYMNVGSSYFNKALQREKRGRETRMKRNEVNALYEKALPYLEKYRALRSKAQHKWAPMLYSIYLNLNLGEQFEEIDKLMKSNNYNDLQRK